MSHDDWPSARNQRAGDLNRTGTAGAVVLDVAGSEGAGGQAARAGPRPTRMLVRALYAEHAGPLLRYALHLTSGDRQRAEDIVQETLLRAWLHPEAIAERPARPWLFAVARNLAVDAYRARKARPHEVGEAALDADAGPGRGGASAGVVGRGRRGQGRCGPSTRVLLETYYRGKSVAEAAAAWAFRPVPSSHGRSTRCGRSSWHWRNGGSRHDARHRPPAASIRQPLGVYVVGAIDPAERAVVDAHLQ